MAMVVVRYEDGRAAVAETETRLEDDSRHAIMPLGVEVRDIWVRLDVDTSPGCVDARNLGKDELSWTMPQYLPAMPSVIGIDSHEVAEAPLPRRRWRKRQVLAVGKVILSRLYSQQTHEEGGDALDRICAEEGIWDVEIDGVRLWPRLSLG